MRSFEHTGGVDQFRLTLGQPTGAVPINFDRRRQQHPDRATGRDRRPADRDRAAAAGVDFDDQKLGATGGHTVLESTGASDARDVYVIEVTGGMNRITIVEVD